MIRKKVLLRQASGVLRLHSQSNNLRIRGARGMRKEEKKTIRILVADDNPQVRSFLRKALEDNEDWKVCCEARNGQEVVDQIKEGKPDIVSIAWPRVPVLMVTLYLSKQLATAARRAGIRGACAKTDIQCLIRGVKALVRGETFFPEWSPV
jgi:DNA-binding NarL/FixJ family response regulator